MTTLLGKNGHEGSIPFARFRPEYAGLQRGRLRFRRAAARQPNEGRLGSNAA